MRLSPATLVHALADARGPEELSGIQAELHRTAGVLATLELGRMARNPLLTPERIRAVTSAVAEACGLSAPSERFLALAMEHGMLPEFARLVRAFDRAALAQGVHRLVVTSAAPIAPEKAEALRAALAARTGGTLAVETRVDPALLGGVRLQLDDQVLDHSFERSLQSLRVVSP